MESSCPENCADSGVDAKKWSVESVTDETRENCATPTDGGLINHSVVQVPLCDREGMATINSLVAVSRTLDHDYAEANTSFGITNYKLKEIAGLVVSMVSQQSYRDSASSGALLTDLEYGTIILHSELVEIKCATTKVGVKATSSTILEKPGCTLIH